ncbi:receptor-type tyrosine-protein phosphatase eta isoform X2 [Lithobates pipiens]
MTFVSGTQYIMLYGNSTNDCCYNFTTKPFNVTQLQAFDMTSTAMNVSWNKPNEYQSSYSYKVQTSVPSSTWISNTTVTTESAKIENLTAGETYTFTVYTIANNSTESDPSSVTKCTVPGEAVNITVNNYQSVNSLVVSWAAPTGNVSNYNVTLTGDVNKTLQNTSTQVTFTDLLPGRPYTITVQTISGSCSRITTVTAATYPTPPRNITFITILANTTTLSWVEPVDMATVTKSYNITYYWSASSPITVRSNSSNAALSSLKSGSNYTITVVTVGVQEYLSTPVSRYVFTRPYPVNQPQYFDVNSTSVSLNWSAPNEYQTVYTYRVQTNVTSPSSIVNDIIVTNLSATIVNLTPGQTYTFLIYTRAADNVTESDPVSLTTCTDPGQAVNVTVNNYRSVNSLVVNWTTPNAGIPLNYTVTITGDVNETLQNTSTQVTLPSLLPGRNYNVTVQAISGSCKSPFTTVTAATYPTPPGNITFNTTANSIALSWVEPANMANLAKSYTITYGNAASSSSSSPTIWTQTSYTNNATLQNLTSGTNYTISVMTVGVGEYQSSPMTISVYTKPRPVSDLNFVNVNSDTVILSWSKPFEYQNTYRYRVQTIATSSSTLRNDTMVNSESATVSNLTSGETYTFFVYVRAADNVTESDPVNRTTCTVPGQAVGVTVNNNQSVNSLAVNWAAPTGNVTNYNVTITGDVNRTLQTTSTQVTFTDLLPGRNYTVTVQAISGSCNSPITTKTEATYPTPPGNITFNTTVNSITLSWVEPVNMTNLANSYIITYGNASSSSSPTIWNQTSYTNSTTLQSLTSGTNYTISVMTVGARGYQSSPVTISVYTKPRSVSDLNFVNVTSNTVILNWSKPIEYQNTYRYRVQTIVTSSSTLKSNIMVNSESATVSDLTPGETYTFFVYVRAADNVTESDPVSRTTCTVPEQAVNVTVNNYQSVNSLVVNWAKPSGIVSNYNVTITGDVNRTLQTTSTQVTFTDLLPGRNYTVTVQTISGSCNSPITAKTEATYPTPPGNITFNTTVNSITLSWVEPVNMTNLEKSYIITYRNAASPTIWNQTSFTNSTTLQSLTSGTNYTISVMTVGVRGYQSSPVTISVYTKPRPVSDLNFVIVTSYTVILNWSKPIEYQNTYRYRVQTIVTSSSTLKSNIMVNNESATVSNLTPGETYTFFVYVRAADNVTESDPVSRTTCTVPGPAAGVTVHNYQSVNSLVVNWTAPIGIVSNYTVTITGDVNRTLQTTSTQVTLTDLLPGRPYTVTVQTISGSCNSPITTVIEATYPTPPGRINFTVIGTKNVTLSWGEPVNMTGVVKSYYITYWKSSSPSIIYGPVISNTTYVTLQNLTSGTNYSVSVATVIPLGYKSTPVIQSVYTKPMRVQSLQINSAATTNISLNWAKPDEYQSSYTYRVQTNATSPTIIVINESATIGNLTPGETYTFNVYVRAADNATESDPVSVTNCTFPDSVSGLYVSGFTANSISLEWTCPIGQFTNFSVTYGTQLQIVPATCNSDRKQNYTIKGLSAYTDYNITVSTLSCERASKVEQIQKKTGVAPPPAPNVSTAKEIKPTAYNQISYTFELLNETNGPVDVYAVIVTTNNVAGELPSKDVLDKTSSDFTSKSTSSYVSIITNVTTNARQTRDLTNNRQHTVQIGDGSTLKSYYNGPLQALTTYCFTVAGFTQINYKPDGTIDLDNSIMTLVPYSYQVSTPQNPGVIAGAVVGTLLGVLVIAAVVGYFVWYRRRNEGKPKENGMSFSNVKSIVRTSLSMSTANFPKHFEKQSADCNLGFSSEYEKLCTVGKRLPKTVADQPENKEKNRYTNVLPYDHSRVTLSTNGNPSDDYINANFIPGFILKKEFIAAQGPLPRTLNDFWRMVWEKDVRAIAMLTRCVELGKVKCDEYWPSRSARKFGNLSVAASNETVLPDWTIRDFIVTNTQTKQSKQVRHFHFTAWPDHGVPKATEDLVQFRNLIRDYTSGHSSPSSPILVHCSAGVGRTGTLIALDRIIKHIEAEDKVDVYGVVYDLRMHRDLMVQTESQYVFLNQCALDFINSRKTQDHDIYQNTESIYQNTESIYQNTESVYQNVTSLYPNINKTDL